MDTTELLNVIDIIKNEDLYNKRLKELQATEQKLKDTKFVVATVDQVNKMREEAKLLIEKNEKMAVTLQREMEEYKRKLDHEHNQILTKLKSQEEQIEHKTKDAREVMAKALSVKKEVETLKIDVQKQYDHWKVEREQVRNERVVLKDRIYQINELMKGL